MYQGETLNQVLDAYASVEFSADLWVEGSATPVHVDYSSRGMIVFGLQGDDIPPIVRIDFRPGEFEVYLPQVGEWANVTDESPDLFLFSILDPRAVKYMLPEEVAFAPLTELGWPTRSVTVIGSLARMLAVFGGQIGRWPNDFIQWLAQPEIDQRPLTFQLSPALGHPQSLKLRSLIQPDLSPDLPSLELRIIDQAV